MKLSIHTHSDIIGIEGIVKCIESEEMNNENNDKIANPSTNSKSLEKIEAEIDYLQNAIDGKELEIFFLKEKQDRLKKEL